MIVWLRPNDPFPSVQQALGEDSDAPGLLAASDDIGTARLLDAYRHGIFPWYSPGQPVLWWSPDPRMVLHTAEFKVSRSLRKTLRRVLDDPAYEVRVDHDFVGVMRACAGRERPGQDGTWITEAIVDAYAGLHRAGLAHCVETWHAGRRIGGLYGVALGKMFFGESMFSEASDASKIALATLVGSLRTQGVQMLDCQQNTSHLASLGAREINRDAFLSHLYSAVRLPPVSWRFGKEAVRTLL